MKQIKIVLLLTMFIFLQSTRSNKQEPDCPEPENILADS